MEKKGVCFARKFILAVGVFFCYSLPGSECRSKGSIPCKRGCNQVYGIFDPLLLQWMVIWHFVWSQI